MRPLSKIVSLSLVAALLPFAVRASAQPAPPQPPEAPPPPPSVTANPQNNTGEGPPPAGAQDQGNPSGAVAPSDYGAPAQPPPASPDFDVTGTAGARGVGLAPPGANTSNFMDTRLSWTFGDDDFLHPTGELVPLSPTFSVADRQQYRLFFDALNSRFSGRENLTHLVMYKKMPGFIEHLTTEAAVVLRFDLAALAANTNNLNSALYDTGSYIRLFYNTHESHPREGISAVFFPLDTDRFRLGYLYDISWGGTAASINQSIFPRIQGSSPGLKVQYDTDRSYVFAGFKTASIVEPQQILNPANDYDVEEVQVADTNFGFLSGGGYDLFDNLRFDVGAGYFQQGKFNLEDVRGERVYTYGGSARVVFHHDMPVPQSVDFILYKNDPNSPMILFAPEKYDPHELAWSLSAEVDYLKQHLKDFDVSGATRDQPALAAALQAVVKAGYARFSATGIYRDLNYVVRNVPGFIPFETLPGSASTSPEIFGAVAADYNIPGLKLTPGIGGGLQLPSTFQSQFTEGGIPASRTIIVRSQGDESILPFDKGRTPIFQGRVSLRWDISDILSAVVWMQYVRDNNGTLVVQDPTEGTNSLRVFQPPDRLGAAASLQARF